MCTLIDRGVGLKFLWRREIKKLKGTGLFYSSHDYADNNSELIRFVEKYVASTFKSILNYITLYFLFQFLQS